MREPQKVLERGTQALSIFPALRRPDVNWRSGGYNNNNQSCCCSSCCCGGGGSLLHENSRRVFPPLKKQRVREETVLVAFFFACSKAKNLAGFFVIVNSSYTPGRAWAHPGTGDSDPTALSHSKTLPLSRLSHWFLDKNWDSFTEFSHQSSKDRMENGSDICACVCARVCVLVWGCICDSEYLRWSLYLLGDAASIYANPTAWAICLHKCCWAIRWLSDSDQYVCYQVQGGVCVWRVGGWMNGYVFWLGRTIFQLQLFWPQLVHCLFVF